MADVSLTVAELETLCQQLTASPRAAVTGYQPSARQVGFFVLVWVAKQQKKQQQRLFQSRADLLAGFDRATLTLHIREVIQQLTLWGEQVTRLKAQDAQEWVLVYKQMEKATKAAAWEQHCSQRTDLIEDALHRAYLKGLLLVRQLFDADVLENSRDIVALVVDHQAALHNAFDFRSGFYPFVRRIAHNELVTLLRGDRWVVDQDFEDLELALPAVAAPANPDELDFEAGFAAARAAFRDQLQRLFQVLGDKTVLRSANHKQVVLHTLVGRPQFARALAETGLALPAPFPPLVDRVSDHELAQLFDWLDKAGQPNVNLVRVHRKHAEDRVAAHDPALGLLLKRLLAAR